MANRVYAVLFAIGVCLTSPARAADANIQYLISGKEVKPWQLGLSFNKVKYAGEKISTLRNSLSMESSKVAQSGDAIRLKWNPKGIKTQWGSINTNILTMNLTNTAKHIDLTSVVDQAALTFDIKVNRSPKDNVDLMLECGWNWECRTKLPLKHVLKRAPKGKWVSIPIPLKCLTNDSFDFSKVTTIFSLQTTGKMDIELSNIQLTALPAGNVSCN